MRASAPAASPDDGMGAGLAACSRACDDGTAEIDGQVGGGSYGPPHVPEVADHLDAKGDERGFPHEHPDHGASPAGSRSSPASPIGRRRTNACDAHGWSSDFWPGKVL